MADRAAEVHDIRLEPLPHLAVQSAPDRRHEQQGAERIGEESRQQQQPARDHQAQAFEYLRHRQ